MLPIFSFGQPGLYEIYGESLWRNQSYGVSNHQFDIENYITTYSTNYPLDPDPITGSCPYEFYTSEDMPLYNVDEDDQVNTLKIRPFSVNNAADYRNGVSTLDLYAIQAHLLNSPSFESRTPTEDFPFRYISGDADYDHDVDEDDIDMIQDLILFYRDDLTRNSWEWVHKDEVEDAEERFEEEPYEFVISYNWPYPEGIILAELSTNQIMADNDKYFTFRTTKIGDITANSTLFVSSLNTWVCGSGSYFTGDNVETRSTDSQSWDKIRGGSILSVDVIVDNQEDIYALELPIYFTEKDFELIEIDFPAGFSPKWYRNAEKGSLIFSQYSRDLLPINIPRGSSIQFKLKAKRDISNIGAAINWHPFRPIELVGEDEIILVPEISIEISNILPLDFYAEVRTIYSTHQIVIESPTDQLVSFKIFNYQGQLVHNEKLRLNRGATLAQLPSDFIPGLYICHLQTEAEDCIVKWAKP